MPPKPLELRRSRWTLFFTLPFTLFIIVTGVGSVFFLFADVDRLMTIFAACGAFVAFCVGGTMGKSVLEALFDKSPAVVIDSNGLNDVRGGEQLFWDAIEAVKLDDYERRILVNFYASDTRSGRVMSTARRLVSDADYTIALSGLSYRPQELSKTQKQFQQRAKFPDAAES